MSARERLAKIWEKWLHADLFHVFEADVAAADLVVIDRHAYRTARKS